jgi:hypothetical protein
MAKRKMTARAQGAPKRLSSRLRDLGARDGAAVHGGAGWQAAKTYRVWDANRKIFVYPENWLQP